MLTDDFFLGTKLYHKKFTELCKPIVKYLGITSVIYLNIDKNGRMFITSDNFKWMERFLEEKYYKLDPLMVHPNNIHNGFSFDNASNEQEFKDRLLYDAVVNFGLCHSFVFIEKAANNDGYSGFAFATTKDNYQIFNRLINEAHIIKKFIRNLNNKVLLMASKDLQENRMDFASLKGDLFHSQKGLVFNEQYEHQNKIQLLKEAGLLSGHGKNFLIEAYLSPQEINCLRIYLTTHSIKKVSRDLNLGITTVTSYIENIKNKLNCINKNELFEKAEILESLGCI
ncbi:MAG: LuxR C-terminal-related transcriptional regulator [Gammaproteobacteria bacterium]|jgi:DNA-binding CsgD family transcriptional regulator